MFCGCDRKHFLGDINAENRRCASLLEFGAVFAIAASKVEDCLTRKIGRKREERWLFLEVVCTVFIAANPFVAVKKLLIVEYILRFAHLDAPYKGFFARYKT